MSTQQVFAAALALPMTFAGAQQPDTKLQTTLAKLDNASVHFTSAQANFHKDLYNALVKETTPQDGSIYFLRLKGGATQMGAKIEGPGARTVEYKNGVLKDYNPGIKCFDTVSASSNKARTESFLTLGFGGSGKDLAKAWNIEDLGPETLSEDGKAIKVEKVDLVPKEQSVSSMVTHVTLWLDLERGISLKQVFHSPSGDTQTAVYSKIRMNERKVDTKSFEIKGNPCGR